MSGRQLFYIAEMYFKLVDLHLPAVAMRGGNLDRFLIEWGTIIAGMQRRLDDKVPGSIIIRQLREHVPG